MMRYCFSIGILVLICAVVFPTTVLAQTPRDLTPKQAVTAQLGVSDAQLFDQLMVTVLGVGSRSREQQQAMSLKPYLMPVRRIGFRGADWSYALASCLEYYSNLQRNFKDNLSPDYISLSLQASGRRASIVEGLQFLAQEGTVSAAIVPYDAAQIPAAVYATNKYRIVNYLHLFQSLASAREKTFEIRKAIVRGNPVVVELQTDAAFAQLQRVREWRAPGAPGTQTHTLVVVGFDESRQAFEVRSAWGSQWGNNGYVWIPYNDFAKVATSGYVMVPTS